MMSRRGSATGLWMVGLLAVAVSVAGAEESGVVISPLRSLSGHDNVISGVAALPDGHRAITSSWDKTLRLWDLDTGQCLRVFTGHTDWVTAVAVTPDGRCAVSASDDGTLKLWDIETGACVRTFVGHTGAVTSVAIRGDSRRAVSGSWDKTVKLWDLTTGKCLRTFAGHTGWVTSVAFAGYPKVLSGSVDKTAKVWDWTTGACRLTLTGHTGAVTAVTSSDGYLITGSTDKTIRYWNPATGKCELITTSPAAINALVSVPYGGDVLSADYDNKVRIWDRKSHRCLYVLAGHFYEVNGVAISQRVILSVSDDQTLKVWDLSPESPPPPPLTSGEILVERVKRLDLGDHLQDPIGQAWSEVFTHSMGLLRLDRPAASAALDHLYDAFDAYAAGALTTMDVLVYVTPPITSDMVLPDTQRLSGAIEPEVDIAACPGELEPASLVLWAPEKLDGLSIAATDLKGPGGAVIPAANVDLKWVKCWYQSGGAPYSVGQNLKSRALVAELLLNDDSLVKVEPEGQHDSLKLSFPDGAKYVPVDDPTPADPDHRAHAEEMPVKDSPTLLPIDLPARFNKQVWIVVKAPQGAKPGRYVGAIKFASGARDLGSIGLNVEVLPFKLPTPRTHYDLTRDYTGSMYYWGELDPKGVPAIANRAKSERQFSEELRDMYEHNIVAPIMIWLPSTVYGNEALFRRDLALTRAAGMSGRPIYFGDSGMIGNPTDPVALEKLKVNVRKTIRICAEYGFPKVYFYGQDEARGERIIAQRTAWQAVHEAGGKVIVSGWRDSFAAAGDLLDLVNWMAEPEAAQTSEWHKAGHLMWDYANPQTPVEDPLIYRRNYGLTLWKSNWDGAATYCFMDGFNQWNDFDNAACRKHNVAYPTIDGVVRTIALEGFREGIDDIKYATLLRQEIEKAGTAGVKDAVWLEAQDFRTADLSELRQEMIRRIVALRRK